MAADRRLRRGLPRWLTLALALLATAAPLPAAAHFLLNLNVRVFHVDHRAHGLDLLVRMPMPYLVADRVGPAGSDGLPAPAPYTTNARSGGQVVHYVAFDQVADDPAGLGRLLAEGLQVEVGGRAAPLEVATVRVHPLGEEPPFATLAEARTAFTTPQRSPPAVRRVYVGDAVVDVLLRVSTGDPVNHYRLWSTLDPGLPGQDDTANLIVDNAPGSVLVFRARGLLGEPVEISRSPLDAFITFAQEGIRHILEGLDHLLFVLCLAAGASGLRGLLCRVTGFTVGHSVTLSLGFFGFVPAGAWFVPAVETTIALTIVLAAWLVFRPPDSGQQANGVRREGVMFAVTSLIGLIHGLGFSFVLQEILKVSSPDIWQSLLAFNVGIEIGQVLIVLATVMVLRTLGRISQRAQRRAALGIATMSGALAGYWAVERTLQLLAAI